MFKNLFKRRVRLPKLSPAELRALRRPRTEADSIEDARELYIFITDTLIGALIEPDRDPESWCRREIREALAANKLLRIGSRQVLRNAQRQPSCFEWCRQFWMDFEFSREAPEEIGPRTAWVDLDAPIKGDI